MKTGNYIQVELFYAPASKSNLILISGNFRFPQNTTVRGMMVYLSANQVIKLDRPCGFGEEPIGKLLEGKNQLKILEHHSHYYIGEIEQRNMNNYKRNIEDSLWEE